MKTEQLKSEIIAFLRGKPKLSEAALNDDTVLISAGLLDSFETFEFITFLESHFGVQFTEVELATENFDTVYDVCRTVQKLLESQAVG